MRYPSCATVLLLAGFLAASPARGQVVPPLVDPPLGPEIVVNETTSGASSPSVAFGPDGSYMAVWAGPDGTQVLGRLLDVHGVPMGDEFQISAGGSTPGLPRVAAGGGGFAVVWVDQGLFFRRFDGHGQALGQAVRLDATGQIGSCDVAVNAAGDALAVWEANGILGQVSARRVSAGGTLGNVLALTASGTGSTGVQVAAAPDGGFLALWDAVPPFPAPLLMARRMDAAGILASPFQVNEEPTANFFVVPDVRPLFRSDGGFSVLWRRGPRQIQLPIPFTVRARSWDAAGNPLTPELAVDFPAPSFLDAARAPGGNTLVFTAATAAGTLGRVFDGDWNPLSGTLVFHPPAEVPQSDPAVAADAAGDFLALWTLGPEPAAPFSSFILGRTLAASTCGRGSDTLCLGAGGRFRAHVAWKNPFNGDAGTGRTLPVTPDTGAFWFFGDQNLDVAVKVLDGSSINGHFWVYVGSLSNVEYTLTVTDTATGAERSYHNPPFQFASRADVEAFLSVGVDPPGGSAPSLTPAPVFAPGCLPLSSGPQTLCLGSGQFTASVQFTDPRTGTAGQATAVSLTEETGAFWFFGPDNLELVVKVLDGRTVNGRFWVFFGALSDVDYTLTVTHTATGQQRMYHNFRGNQASVADIEAF
ncbi:MAG: hypothetical protein WAM82_13130 [Thermoanaerobaculia bacterium]